MERITYQPIPHDAHDVRAALAKLRLELKGEANLDARSDTDFLLRFLRFADFDVEAALAMTKKYYKIKASCPKVLKDLVPSDEAKSLAQNLVVVLPHKDAAGRPILLIKLGAWDPSSLPQYRFQRAVNVWLEHLTRDPAAQTAGISAILDFSGWTASKILACEIGLVRQACRLVQECLPLKISKVHVVKQPKAFNVFFALLKPFFNKEELSRFQLHGESFEKMHVDVPRSILPGEYGGTGSPVDFEVLCERLQEEDSEFKENNAYGYSEAS